MARRRPATVHGTLIVDKPAGPTSHDVVAMLRRRFGERRIGHAGTLDPSATGVLVVGVGAATRLLRFAAAGRKCYECEIVFGVSTSTLDADGEVVATHDMRIDPSDAAAAAAGFVGKISQVPPMVSAVRVGGRRLHEIARAGETAQRQPREVEVYSFEVEPETESATEPAERVSRMPAGPGTWPDSGPDTGPDTGAGAGLVYRARVSCSAGTFVRSLGADLGAALGGGAHIRSLRRTRSGPFTAAEAAPPQIAALLATAEIVRDLCPIALSTDETAAVRRGAHLHATRYGGAGPWALFDSAGDLAAVHELVSQPDQASRLRATVLAVSSG